MIREKNISRIEMPLSKKDIRTINHMWQAWTKKVTIFWVTVREQTVQGVQAGCQVLGRFEIDLIFIIKMK